MDSHQENRNIDLIFDRCQQYLRDNTPSSRQKSPCSRVRQDGDDALPEKSGVNELRDDDIHPAFG